MKLTGIILTDSFYNNFVFRFKVIFYRYFQFVIEYVLKPIFLGILLYKEIFERLDTITFSSLSFYVIELKIIKLC